MWILISLLYQKPADLNQHCFQNGKSYGKKKYVPLLFELVYTCNRYIFEIKFYIFYAVFVIGSEQES